MWSVVTCREWTKTWKKNTTLVWSFKYVRYLWVTLTHYVHFGRLIVSSAQLLCQGSCLLSSLWRHRRLGLVCVYSRQGHRGRSLWSYLHIESPKASQGWELSAAVCWISSDRACNQQTYMRCVWDKLLDSLPPWYVTNETSASHRQTQTHTWSQARWLWLRSNWERTELKITCGDAGIL